MSSRLGRAWRGVSLACLALAAAFAAAPVFAQAQVVAEGVAPPGSSNGVIAVAAGWHHSCALQGDGSAVCWGNNDGGAATPPPGVRFSAISAGWFDTCGVRQDGELECWGLDPELQQVPSGPFVSVALSDQRNACALRVDGSVACWGMGYYPGAPQPVQAYQALSAAGEHSCGLRADGGIDCWRPETAAWPMAFGNGTYRAVAVGQAQVCGLEQAGDVRCWDLANQYEREGRPGPFTALTAGGGGVCALDAAGQAQCWGSGAQFLGPVPADAFVSVIAGNDHACAIRATGTVACWGGDYFGESNPPPGPASVQAVAEGVARNGQGKVRALASGEFHTCALLDDGRVSCWGENYFGQATSPTGIFRAIGAGGFRSCGVRIDGTVACWGDRADGVAPGEFVSVAVALDQACALRADGSAACWGNGSWQPSGRYLLLSADRDRVCGLRYDGSAECWNPWGNAQVLAGGPYTALSMSMGQVCGVQAGGEARCWSLDGDYEREGRPGPFSAVSTADRAVCALLSDGRPECWGHYWSWDRMPAGTFTALSAGTEHFCGIRADGSVACWGENEDLGELTPPRALTQPPSIAAGARHTCAVGADGQAECWGDNLKGQAMPPAGETFAFVGAGDAHSCGMREDGTIHCWGDNAEGQLDAPLEPMTKMSIGRLHGCALDAQGLARCWGLDNHGQGTPPPYMVFDEISAGFAHSCGVVRGGPGMCWGYDGDGQTYVPSLPWEQRWLSIQAGERHSCGLASDGTVQCWGSDSDGQTWPAPTGYFRTLSVGAFHNCAIRTDGRLACWGANWAGQTIAPQGTFVSVSAGANHTCAIASDGARQCWGANLEGQAPRRHLVPEQIWWDIRYNEPVLIHFSLLDGDPPYYSGTELPAYFRLAAGTLPAGLELTPAGELSGTPTTAGTYTFTVSGIGQDGFGASREFTVTIDATPPTITPFYSWPSTNFNGWYTGNVEISWWVEDAESSAWPLSGCENRLFNADTTGTTISCTGQSAGGTATHSLTIKRDATAPETSISVSPAAVTNRTDTQFAFGGSDATSGVSGYECSLDGAAFAACTSPHAFFVSPSGGSHTFRVRAVDNAGHRDASPASHTWLVDTAPPVVTPTVTGPQGANGWYVGDVHIAWTVGDAESAIVSSTGCNAVTLASDTAGASFTCTATNAAGGTVSRTVTVKRDATAPEIVAAPTTAANGAGWYRADVTVAFACSDALSGTSACPVAQVLGGEGTAIASAARTIVDAAGNSATSNVVTVKIDRTAPTVAPDVAPEMLLNAANTATANGGDGLSGVATETCAALATATVGTRNVACTVTDRAGNSASASAGYRVVYGFNGFTAPVQNPAVLNVLKAGRSVALRWRVVDAQGAPVSNLAAASVGVGAIAIGCPTATENRIGTYGGSNGQLQNLGNGYYQLDWMAAASLRGACRRLELNLGDGVVRPALFKFN